MKVALAPRMARLALSRQPFPSSLKEKRAAPAIKPQHSEEKSHVADARGDERLFCSRRRARLLDPKSNEANTTRAPQAPKDEKQKQTVGNNQPEHRTGEERKVRKEPGEIFVLGHVTDAENKNAKPKPARSSPAWRQPADQEQNRDATLVSPNVNQVKFWTHGNPAVCVVTANATIDIASASA